MLWAKALAAHAMQCKLTCPCIMLGAAAAAAELRSALEARSAEASLYRKQYESLCRKLDSLEEHQRQASAAARAKVQSPLHYRLLTTSQCMHPHNKNRNETTRGSMLCLS